MFMCNWKISGSGANNVVLSLSKKFYPHCSSPPSCINGDLTLANAQLQLVMWQLMSCLSEWCLGGTTGAHTIIHEVWPLLLWVGLSQKSAQYGFGNFPKILPIVLFMLPIMLVLCSNMNNIDVKFYCFNLLLG